MESARELKERGMERVTGAATADEVFLIDTAIELCAARNGGVRFEFTAEDVRKRLPAGAVLRPNLIGARLHRAKRLGTIKEAGVTRATRPSSHGRVLLRWIKA
jgi:hypothetical protein